MTRKTEQVKLWLEEAGFRFAPCDEEACWEIFYPGMNTPDGIVSYGEEETGFKQKWEDWRDYHA